MRVLVTGAGGYLGRHLVPLLLEQGHQVACLTRSPENLPLGWEHLPQGKAEPTGQGVRDLCLSFRPQVVLHLAALYITEHRFEDIAPLVQANLLLGTHVLDAMRVSGCGAMVFAGTSWQHYQDADYKPANLYAASKQAFSVLAEYYLDACSLRLLELHLYDSYGEDDTRKKLINLLKNAAQSAEILPMTAGEQILHLVHVDDVAIGFAQACRAVLSQPAGTRRIYRLPSERPVSLRELVERFNATRSEQTVCVDWDAQPYREREVFRPWEAAPVLPGWRPAIDLDQGLRRVRGEGRRQQEEP